MLESVVQYYAEKLERFGATACGVDWNGTASQVLRFAQLVRALNHDGDASVIDYGCGYGALVDYLDTVGRPWAYQGFDIAESMIERARALHPTTARCSFTADPASLLTADYVLASGIFNVKLDIETGVWRDHVLETLETLDALSRSGFAFNVLSTSSDPKLRRGDLFYAEPLFFLDHCTRRFSPRVALLHDYPLYEFTLVVRK